MDPAACRVIYIDDRFNTERWISREGLAVPTTPTRIPSQTDFGDLPKDLQTNVNAFLSVFNQVFVCSSGRSFSTKLSEILDQVKGDCTPILACFDVGSQAKHDYYFKNRPKTTANNDEPLPSPNLLRRVTTFASENDESYGLQLLSRIASDLQVDEGVKLIIPVAVVKPYPKDSYDQTLISHQQEVARAPYGSETVPAKLDDNSDIINPQLMLQCLDAGALDVVKSPLDKAGIMGLTVHAYRIYKSAKAEQSHFMANTRRPRKQSWVGVDEEKPYAYLREAMVRKLLKGICDPTEFIEDYQHRDLYVDESRQKVVADAIGKWSYSGQDFTEDELVYAGYFILNHALQSAPELSKWRMSKDELLRFMQGCRIAYNEFVLYHNFKHAVDVLQSTFYFLLQIGILPPYPPGSESPPHANDKSPIAKLLGPFEALTLLIAAIGHDVGHPGVNNMFLVKLNAPLAQLYNDTSVLEAFHCAAYSQILRRHWPVAFHDKAVRKLMISSILATDMGCHSDYMQQLGNLQEKIHESKNTDGWSPKDRETFRVLACGLLIKCADISNVARPWQVAEKWTYKLQDEFAHQGEMESSVGMETTLFGGPPEIGNMLKLANGQIGFMTIFAHPLFHNVSDIIPAMSFAADEILVNKGVWFTRAEHEKMLQTIGKRGGVRDGGVSPRTQSPVGSARKRVSSGHSPVSLPQHAVDVPRSVPLSNHHTANGSDRPKSGSQTSSLAAVAAIVSPEKKPNTLEPTAGTGFSTIPPKSDIEPKLKEDATGSSNSDGGSTTPKGLQSNSGFDGNTDHAATSKQELADDRRDNGVSMRAGSDTIPEPLPQIQTQSEESTESAFSKFTFATSNQDEPTREYNPEQTYSPAHASSRASAPMNSLGFEERKMEMTNENEKLPQSVPNEVHTTETSTRGIANDEGLTPSQSTEATSYTTTEKSDDALRSPKLGVPPHTPRNRAISAPNQDFAILKPSYSLNSTESTSREGSKNDVRATIISNGDRSYDETSNSTSVKRDRKMSTKSVGRKRSKLKLNLAFWKKCAANDRSMTEEDHENVT